MKEIDVTKRSLGISFTEDGNAVACTWAPLVKQVAVQLEEKTIPLQKMEYGYWSIISDEIKPGDRYKIQLDEEDAWPDPVSLSQPDGVHQGSEAIDIGQFKWTDNEWKNPPLEEYIIYELHTGTFTSGSNFKAIEEKLDYLKELGITAIEIMPVAQFPGTRNWGYDGVFPFAVQNSYGGAKGLQQLVNACHQKGLAVILDVVYNHFGPEGNYLHLYGPYFTDKYKTPWGQAINFDDAYCDGVRHYFIENALMWFRDFHIDALRLDAVHAIKDFSPTHILKEIRQHVDQLMQAVGKEFYLIAESDLNDNRFINNYEQGGYGLNAQWIDEFHHALRVTAGGSKTGYYADFNGIEHLAKAYADAYVYDGQYSEHRHKFFGIKTNNLGSQFIVFSQNHDQVGNRMLGERTSQLHSSEMQKLLATAVLFSPYLPMLFMGEEYGEPNPFQYFVSHTDPALAAAVRKGRKEEFAAFHIEGEAPDPMDEETFQRSKLQWHLINEDPHRTLLSYYKTLIHLRKTQPALRNLNRKQLVVEYNEQWKTLTMHRWQEEQQLICFMNFSDKQQYVPVPSMVNQWAKLLHSADKQWNGNEDALTSIMGGIPGVTTLTLQPESALIYVTHIV
jgi:maltooligosyltrehalose trehalohydrolase